jgi:hypothetical protein
VCGGKFKPIIGCVFWRRNEVQGARKTLGSRLFGCDVSCRLVIGDKGLGAGGEFEGVGGSDMNLKDVVTLFDTRITTP